MKIICIKRFSNSLGCFFQLLDGFLRWNLRGYGKEIVWKIVQESPVVLDSFFNQMILATLEIDYQGLISSCSKSRQVILSQLDWIINFSSEVGQGLTQCNSQESEMFYTFFRKLHKNQVIGLEVFRNTELFFPEINQCYWCLQQIVCNMIEEGIFFLENPSLGFIWIHTFNFSTQVFFDFWSNIEKLIR